MYLLRLINISHRIKGLVCLCLFFYLTSLVAQQRSVSITIDDLPATSDISQYEYITNNILQTLTKNKIPAIGFVNEEKLYNNGVLDSTKIKILEKWLKSGMELGNHTFSHIYINNATLEEYKNDVLKGEIITRPLMKKYGKELKYFRHTQLRTGPTNEYRNNLTKFLNEKGYTIAPVTIDNDEYIYAFCYTQAKAEGNLKLMKKIGSDYLEYMKSIFEYYEQLSLNFLGYEVPQTLLIHANNINADYLDELIAMMKDKRYSFISLVEALKDKAYSLPDGTHSRGLSWIQRWMISNGQTPDSHPPVTKFIEELYQKYRR